MENKEPHYTKREWITVPKEPIVMSTVDNLRVLYEDNHIIAINKRNSDIIQSDISGDTTLCDVVKGYVKWKYNKPGLAFIGTVHRLDRPVSGIVLYARTTKALNRLSNMFKYREVQKTYWAVIKGVPEEPEGTVINYLWKDEKQNKTFTYNEPAGNRKESELSYKMIVLATTTTSSKCILKQVVITKFALLWRVLGVQLKAILNTEVAEQMRMQASIYMRAKLSLFTLLRRILLPL
jgi:23S rRNA-/tRNA-specific pseudouridylate synthase